MGPLDPQWKDDPSMKAFDEFLAKEFFRGRSIRWFNSELGTRAL